MTYNRKVKLAHPDCDTVRKNRFCFVYKNQYFELDVFTEPERLRGLIFLEIELTEENDKVEVPPWIGKATEVTGNPKFSNFALAHRP